MMNLSAWLGLGLAAVVAAWVARRYQVKRWEAREASSRVFKVKPDHLHERLTVAQIEQLEKVQDPMQAVPDVPFGHLHAAWRRFQADLAASDELWSFAARWEGGWRKELYAGYVVVQNGVPGRYFLTYQKQLEDGQ